MELTPVGRVLLALVATYFHFVAGFLNDPQKAICTQRVSEKVQHLRLYVIMGILDFVAFFVIMGTLTLEHAETQDGAPQL